MPTPTQPDPNDLGDHPTTRPTTRPRPPAARRSLAQLWHAFAPLRLPLPALGGQCLLCRQWSRDRLCPPCQAAARPPPGQGTPCERCALAMPPHTAGGPCGRCLRQPPAFDRSHAALDYRHPWDRLLLDFKFQAQPQLARPLADLMRDTLANADRPDLLCCVPLSRERLAERGYNQSHELARRLATALVLPYAPRLMVRLPGPALSRLHAGERRKAVRGAFLTDAADAPRLRGARIAVVDDVMTTGATMNEVARTLTRAGAHEVQAWVLMRAR